MRLAMVLVGVEICLAHGLAVAESAPCVPTFVEADWHTPMSKDACGGLRLLSRTIDIYRKPNDSGEAWPKGNWLANRIAQVEKVEDGWLRIRCDAQPELTYGDMPEPTYGYIKEAAAREPGYCRRPLVWDQGFKVSEQEPRTGDDWRLWPERLVLIPAQGNGGSTGIAGWHSVRPPTCWENGGNGENCSVEDVARLLEPQGGYEAPLFWIDPKAGIPAAKAASPEACLGKAAPCPLFPILNHLVRYSRNGDARYDLVEYRVQVPKLDLGFVVDSTISMKAFLPDVVRAFRGLASRFTARLGVVAFKDYLNPKTCKEEGRDKANMRVVTLRDAEGLVSEVGTMTDQVRRNYQDRADAFAGVQRAIDDLSWNVSAAHHLVLITDADPRLPGDACSATQKYAKDLREDASKKGITLHVVHLRLGEVGKGEVGMTAYRELVASSDGATSPDRYHPLSDAKQLRNVLRDLVTELLPSAAASSSDEPLRVPFARWLLVKGATSPGGESGGAKPELGVLLTREQLVDLEHRLWALRCWAAKRDTGGSRLDRRFLGGRTRLEPGILAPAYLAALPEYHWPAPGRLAPLMVMDIKELARSCESTYERFRQWLLTGCLPSGSRNEARYLVRASDLPSWTAGH